jgi:SAM-dependent methyltransferase
MATAPVAKQAIGIDISERGVRTAQEEADRRGLANAEFRVMDAHKTEFEDESFDLVTATGVIHHLDVPVAFKEIHRLLKPGGTGLFVEALGHNPAIALYRRLTPAARSDDEAPLKRRDFRVAEALFDKVEYDFHGLATLAAVPVWGSRFGLPMLKATRALDRVLLSVPGLRWNAWAVLVRLKKQR